MKLEKKLPEVHPKEWGAELWVENKDYCGKVLLFREPGRGTTVHYHLSKEETMYVERGALMVELVDPETAEGYSINLVMGESLFIPRGQPHRLTPLIWGTVVMEFSGHHEDSDSFRVGPRRPLQTTQPPLPEGS